MSGLVLRLAAHADVPNLIRELEARPGVEAGALQGVSLPVVVETVDAQEALEVHRWMESLTAVRRVEVVHVSF